MLRTMSLLFLALSSAAAASAQFPFSIGGTGQDYGKAIAVDNEQNIVVAALFEGTLDADPGPGTLALENPAGVDLLVAKYTPSGSLVWARNVSAAGLVTPHGAAVDGDDNIVVIGYFGITGGSPSTGDFDPGSGVASLTNTGGWDPFVLKLDSNGQFLWARTFGSTTATTTDERSWDVALDTNGDVYVSGFFSGTYDLDASPVDEAIVSSQGQLDAFLVKYDSSGAFLWGFGLGGSADDEGFSVALGSGGTVFLQGRFSGTVDFDPGPGETKLTSSGQTDLFIAKYSSFGTFEDVAVIGSAGAETSPPGTMRCDASGNVFLSGRFRGSVDLDPGSGSTIVTNDGLTDNLFVASYGPGLDFRWGFSVESDGTLDGGHRVVPTANGAVYVAGWFGGSADFDGGVNVNRISSSGTEGATDVFLAKYGADGAFQWVRSFGAPVSGDGNLSIAAGLACDLQDNAYITGQFFGEPEVSSPSRSVTLSNGGRNDTFVVKYDSAGEIVISVEPDRRRPVRR